MDLNLLDGVYSQNDALDLITKLIHVKIQYHENKIQNTQLEEDIKMRENRIIELQKELYDFRKTIHDKKNKIRLSAIINYNIHEN
ncbi:MAG: hypothetical protein AB7O73_11240 [Bacteroidia bacterium]